MATRINVESGYSDEEEDASTEPVPPEGIRSDTTLRDLFIFFTVIFIVVGAVLAGIFFGVLLPYTKIDVPPPRNTTTNAPDGDGKTTTAKVTEPPIVVTTTKPFTCYPNQTYKWLKDVDIPDSKMRLSLFSGQVTQWKMLSICNRINRPSRSDEDESYGALYFNNKVWPDLEKKVDKIIRDNKDEILGSSLLNQLMWTGWAYIYDEKESKWKAMNARKMPDLFRLDGNYETNFRDDNNFLGPINKLKDSPNKDIIYFVKDYSDKNACWRYYTKEELNIILGQPEDTLPRLPFACLTEQSTEYTGKDAIPGNFKPKKKWINAHNDDKTYWLYGVAATLDDAYAECKEHGQQLAVFNDTQDLDKFHKHIIEEIRKDPSGNTGVKPRSEFDRFWTGGYLNILVNPFKDIRWIGKPGVKSKHSDADFPNFSATQLDVAFDAMSQRARKKKNPYCFNQDKLYVGVHFSKEYTQKLTVLNSGADVDPDTTIVYVLCEEIKK